MTQLSERYAHWFAKPSVDSQVWEKKFMTWFASTSDPGWKREGDVGWCCLNTEFSFFCTRSWPRPKGMCLPRMPSWPHWWAALALCTPGTSSSRELDPSCSLTRGTIQILVRKSPEKKKIFYGSLAFLYFLFFFIPIIDSVSMSKLRHLEQPDCCSTLQTFQYWSALVWG